MSTTLSAKYYQENKERLQKKLTKDINIFIGKTVFFITKRIRCFLYLGFASYLLKYKNSFLLEWILLGVDIFIF